MMPDTARIYGLAVDSDYDERRSVARATDAAVPANTSDGTTSQAFTVAPKALEITANDRTKTYGQEVTFAPLGPKPVLAYSSRSWLLNDDGTPGRPAAAETGWWRQQPDGAVEVLLAYPTGITEVYVGTVDGTRIEMATDVVARTSSAKEVSAGRRLYGLVDDELMYALDMAAVGQPPTPHLSARLRRVEDAVAAP